MKPWNSQVIAAAFAEAAVEPSSWVKAMDTIARETRSVGAILLPFEGQLPSVPMSETLARSTEKYFQEGWFRHDERFRTFDTMNRDGFADDFAFTTPEEMRRHPYWQDFLRPVGLQYFGGVKVAAGDDIWCVSIQRSTAQGPFSRREKQTLAALSRELGSAAALARALSFAAGNAAVEAFEVTGSAVALLDRRGKVIRLNHVAEALLVSPDLGIKGKRIVSYDSDATAALDGALRAVLWAATPSALMQPVPLPRRTKRPILAYAVRLSTVSSSIFADCQAVLVFVDLEKRVRPPQEALHSSFALTPAEARLALRIASGAQLEAIADELCISKETARSQLKAVFQKTKVSRQAELVALLASFLNARE